MNMVEKQFMVLNGNILMSDLLYCGSKDENDKLQTFRYTQNQRRLETRTKKYNKIIEEVNNTTFINGKILKKLRAF